MLGPIVDSGALAVGGICGVMLANVLPERVKSTLPLIFGVVTISLGATLVGGAAQFPVVVMTLILGAFIGELCYIERGLERLLRYLIGFSRKQRVDDHSIVQFITLVAAICFGSMGLFGAVNEGITGKPDILLTKAVLDLFTGIVFGAAMGLKVSFIAIPQFVILAVLYLSGAFLMRFVSPDMLANFTSAGGVIFLATGLRLCGIKVFPVINMLPALLFVFPLTWLWGLLF